MKHDVIHAGNDSGDLAIVAVHGIQGTRASWQRVQPLLGDAHWILPNLRGRADAWRGHGPQDYTLDAFGGEVCDVIDAHVTRAPYVLAGWSMGTSVSLAAFDLLRRAGHALPAALILMSGSPLLREVQWFGRGDHDTLLTEIAAREERLGLRSADNSAADRDAVAWTWQAISGTDQRALLAGIDVPVLILHGSDDEDSPFEHAQLLADGLPDATLVRIDGGRHAILTQHAERVATEIRHFLSQHHLTGVTQ